MAHAAVDGYFRAMTEHDFALLATVVADDVVRVGPYGDTYTGRAAYVGFISGLLPSLPGHALEVHALTYAGDARRVFAEISETVIVDGAPLVTPEVIVLDLDADDLISAITIYIQTRGNE